MKPLLIIPPCPARWHALESLLSHEDATRLADVEQRFTAGVAGGQDVFAVIPDGGQILANACIAKRGDVGVLGHVFTREAHRKRGYARALVEAVVSWFDMLGGKWLYVVATDELADRLSGKLAFEAIHRAERDSQTHVAMVRRAGEAQQHPLEASAVDTAIRDVTRADYPLIVALLQHRPGADPRVSLSVSAVAAETAVIDLLHQQERGTCQLKAAVCGERIIGLASVATDQLGERTFAMQMPHDDPLSSLREAIVEFAGSKGYTQVDFPLETLVEDREAQDVTVDGGEA